MPETQETVLTFKFSIVTPYGVAFTGKVSAIQFESCAGLVEILPLHEPIITTIKIGLIIISTPIDDVNVKQTVYAVHGGFLQKVGEEVTVYAMAAESGDAIDLNRAQEAAQRARKCLEQMTHNPEEMKLDIDHAHLALLRAIARINAREVNTELKLKT